MKIFQSIFISLLFFSISAQAFVVNTAKWPQPTTTMNLGDLTGNSPSGQSWRSAFTEAALAWNNTTNFTFILTNDRVPSCQGEGSNYVAFAANNCGSAFGDTTLAVTVESSFTNAPTVTIKTDLLYNSAFTWDIYSGSALNTPDDFRRVTVHELGHALGLNHETVATAIMFPSVGNIELPTVDDRNGVASLYGPPANNTNDPDIILILETPGVNLVHNGIANIQGWVISKASIAKVEFYVDGALIGNVPHGGTRADVGAIYPQYPGSNNSGFSMAWNYAVFKPGQHTALVRVFDVNGKIKETSSIFSTIEFNNTDFFPDPNKIDLRGTTYRAPTEGEMNYQAHIDNVLIDGKRYSILLRWNTGSQKFEINGITPN